MSESPKPAPPGPKDVGSRIRVWTDGGCIPNPGPGGWAWAVPGASFQSGAVADTSTNQRMELTAVLEAIRALRPPLQVLSDSKYVVNCFLEKWWLRWLTNGWRNSKRKPVENRDLWEPLIELVRDRDIQFQHVEAHVGEAMNEFVDALAKEACRLQLGRRGTCPLFEDTP